MALDTLRANKLRSGLTVLGIVIGITSIVGMTALILGFDESLRDLIRGIGANTVFVSKLPPLMTASGPELTSIGRVRGQVVFGDRALMDALRSAQIVATPREGASREIMTEQIREVVRARHRLRLDEPDDFEIYTQDAVIAMWGQISQATFLALVVISSIALMVGGIGVMAIMTISVTERTREIGVRKALGARRIEILWRFLAEAVFLTSAGGLMGIALGSGLGLGVHWLTGFPVSLPWWSFALGIGFSAAVGIFFGLDPAMRASALDPIDALQYE